MTKDILHRFAQRARQDRFFLGAMLQAYQQWHGYDDVALADYLECRVPDIQRLAVCRAPSQASKQFRPNVTSIAKYVDCNPDKLLSLLREVEATNTLRDESAPSTWTGFMLAARDRKTESAPSENKPDANDRDGT